MHRNASGRSQWEVPGGKAENDEKLEQTAIRELLEELGVTITVVRYIGSKDFEQDGERHTYHWFTATITQGIPMILEDTFDDLRYFSIADMQRNFGELSANTQNLVRSIQTREVGL